MDKVKIVIPNWVVDCIKAKKLLDESKYAPVHAAEPGSKSDSILTPDNNGQTTGVVINANIEKAKETPSSLLSPESPSTMKLKNDSVEKIDTKGECETNACSSFYSFNMQPYTTFPLHLPMLSGNCDFVETEEPLKEVSEEVAAVEEREESSDEPEKKTARQAAQNAKERLKTVAKLCEDTDEMDSDYNEPSASGEKLQEPVEGSSDAGKQVFEISDEDKSNNCEKVKQLSENKVVVVCKSLVYTHAHQNLTNSLACQQGVFTTGL